MSQMAVCESCGQRFDYGSGVIHTHEPVDEVITIHPDGSVTTPNGKDAKSKILTLGKNLNKSSY